VNQPGDLEHRFLGDDLLDAWGAKPEPFVAGPLCLHVAFQRAEDLVTDDHNVLSLVADEQVGFELIIGGALAVESGERTPLAGRGGAATSRRPVAPSISVRVLCASFWSREAASCCCGYQVSPYPPPPRSS